MTLAALRGTRSPVTARHTPVAVLAGTAALVVAIDTASKGIALRVLPELEWIPTAFLQLAVVHNADLAGGISFGVGSAVMTAVAALLILGLAFATCGALAAHDRAAPVMLGLIVGAGVANAGDALVPPTGVVDWIVVGAGGGIVLNLADVAVAAGVGLCARTAGRLVVEIRNATRASEARSPGSKS